MSVVEFPGTTLLDIPAERVLKGALERGLASVVIAGRTEDGEEFFASSLADGGHTLWMIERLKQTILKAEGRE
jgi:hypothetical protein